MEKSKIAETISKKELIIVLLGLWIALHFILDTPALAILYLGLWFLTTGVILPALNIIVSARKGEPCIRIGPPDCYSGEFLVGIFLIFLLVFASCDIIMFIWLEVFGKSLDHSFILSGRSYSQVINSQWWFFGTPIPALFFTFLPMATNLIGILCTNLMYLPSYSRFTDDWAFWAKVYRYIFLLGLAAYIVCWAAGVSAIVPFFVCLVAMVIHSWLEIKSGRENREDCGEEH